MFALLLATVQSVIVSQLCRLIHSDYMCSITGHSYFIAIVDKLVCLFFGISFQ